jgi:hypothetical protein
MKNIKVILAVLSLSMLSLAQTNQKPKTETSPNVTQRQILELPLNRESQPLVLFERALKDKDSQTFMKPEDFDELLSLLQLAKQKFE